MSAFFAVRRLSDEHAGTVMLGTLQPAPRHLQVEGCGVVRGDTARMGSRGQPL